MSYVTRLDRRLDAVLLARSTGRDEADGRSFAVPAARTHGERIPSRQTSHRSPVSGVVTRSELDATRHDVSRVTLAFSWWVFVLVGGLWGGVGVVPMIVFARPCVDDPTWLWFSSWCQVHRVAARSLRLLDTVGLARRNHRFRSGRHQVRVTTWSFINADVSLGSVDRMPQ